MATSVPQGPEVTIAADVDVIHCATPPAAGEYDTQETAATEDEASEVILRALSLGISFLNTSDLYGPFENEHRIGALLVPKCTS